MSAKTWSLREFVKEASERYPALSEATIRQAIYRREILPTEGEVCRDSRFDSKSLRQLDVWATTKSRSYRAYLLGRSSMTHDIQANEALGRVELIIGAPGPVAQQLIKTHGLPSKLIKVSAKSREAWAAAAPIMAAASNRREMQVKLQRAKYHKSRKRGK